MASTQEWYYSRNGKQLGPVTAVELKGLASTGKLSPSDLIWKEGWDEWKSAGVLKGLFADSPPSKPTPPPLSVSSNVRPSNTSGTVSEAVKSDLSDLMNGAKRAKDFAVAQARRTQISQLTLPKAYRALGERVFAEGRFRDEFAEVFEKISAINVEIDNVRSSSAERPEATDLKGKLQFGAASFLAHGQVANLGTKRDSQLRMLGKKVFELHGSESGAPDVVSPINDALEEIRKIDGQIASFSSPERVPLWQRTPIAAIFTVCCFPVGFYLLWCNPRISRRTKFIWLGAFGCLMVLGSIATYIETENAKTDIAAANQLWSSGDHTAAILKYRTLVNNSLSVISDSDRSLILGRLIDFDAESGNISSVERLLTLAENREVVPSVSSEKARSIQETWHVNQRLLAQQKEEAERNRMVEAPSSREDRSAESVYQFALPKKRQYTDEDFHTLDLTGATPKQVLEHFGKPDDVHKGSQYNDAGDIRSSKESWNYYNLVRHSVTGKRLALHIYFRHSDGNVVTHEVL